MNEKTSAAKKPMISPESDLVPYPEAARITCVSERTLKRMVEAGELREYEFRGSRRLSRAELLTPGPRHLSDRRQA
ncbi:hypothetical protein GCM10008955_34910 [Deinococcus malanensis]|uniref:Helix-turn-helix domain-containing protein n=1 Tax=Deinococcus malanensis TaxID=1706855 RepID=A0ABQ2F158_9DEIO|nr:excisionase family DNA-binding protein [Deinococcus malanensis]GGK38020.1 hypothetical protein GCM10008955_34910 [Deinococcus malanensis]